MWVVSPFCLILFSTVREEDGEGLYKLFRRIGKVDFGLWAGGLLGLGCARIDTEEVEELKDDDDDDDADDDDNREEEEALLDESDDDEAENEDEEEGDLARLGMGGISAAAAAWRSVAVELFFSLFLPSSFWSTFLRRFVPA